MKLSNHHRQDLLSLSKVFDQQERDITIKLAEKYGSHVAYRYIDLHEQNKPLRETFFSKLTKSLNRIFKRLKQIKNGIRI